MNWIAVALGAGLGGCLRYSLHCWLPAAEGRITWSTMAANWVGAYVAGLLVAWFTQIPDLAPAWRLFLMTGLLGGLTTFSTFSVEALHLMQRGTLPLALAHIGLHVIGSLLFCYAGYETLHR